MTLPVGVYPASVTPFNSSGSLDAPSILRLMAHFESAGCRGVVLAGTNGEGPSLAAVEKRDLLRIAQASKGDLKLILAIATSSLSEAQWLCEQTAKNGGDAVLVMAPSYFKREGSAGIRQWFVELLDSSPVPVLIYNYPKMNGVTLDKYLVSELTNHQNYAGIKDSSGEESNLETYRAANPAHCSLFVGDERLLIQSLKAGWTGSISGAANLIPGWLSRVVREWESGEREQAETTFKFILPIIEKIRSFPQPESNKFVLRVQKLISEDTPRLPLLPCDATELVTYIESQVGFSALG